MGIPTKKNFRTGPRNCYDVTLMEYIPSLQHVVSFFAICPFDVIFPVQMRICGFGDMNFTRFSTCKLFLDCIK